jgi:hypothetical protein
MVPMPCPYSSSIRFTLFMSLFLYFRGRVVLCYTGKYCILSTPHCALHPHSHYVILLLLLLCVISSHPCLNMARE